MTSRDSRLASDDELSNEQLKAMDRLWCARRAGIDAGTIAELELLVRAGRVRLAYRRLADARRGRDHEPGAAVLEDGGG